MAVVRWDPFRDLGMLQDRMNRLFEDTNRGWRSDEPASTTTWSPAVDIFETEGEIIVKAELPGMDRKDIALNLEKNVLTLKGERRFEKEAKEENYHRIERSYGGFSRSFSIPATVDDDKIRADYKDGVLTIALPKKEQAKPKQIRISEWLDWKFENGNCFIGNLRYLPISNEATSNFESPIEGNNSYDSIRQTDPQGARGSSVRAIPCAGKGQSADRAGAFALGVDRAEGRRCFADPSEARREYAVARSRSGGCGGEAAESPGAGGHLYQFESEQNPGRRVQGSRQLQRRVCQHRAFADRSGEREKRERREAAAIERRHEGRHPQGPGVDPWNAEDHRSESRRKISGAAALHAR